MGWESDQHCEQRPTARLSWPLIDIWCLGWATLCHLSLWNIETTTILEAIATRFKAIASRVEAIASRVEAIASRVEAIARPSLVGWRLSLLGWRPLGFFLYLWNVDRSAWNVRRPHSARNIYSCTLSRQGAVNKAVVSWSLCISFSFHPFHHAQWVRPGSVRKIFWQGSTSPCVEECDVQYLLSDPFQ